MGKIDRNDIQPAEFERTFYRHGNWTDVVPGGSLLAESIGEHAPQIVEGSRGGVDRHGFVIEFAEPAQVVEAQNVIGVGVGVNNGVDARDALPQTLGTEVGRGIDLKHGLAGPEQGGRAQAFVPCVAGSANPALAANHGYAVRGARA